MKKLLAIAVAVAFAAPAMADTSVYGKAHVSINKADGSTVDLQSHTSRIGLKGSNALDNGLTATHQFELGVNPADSAAKIYTDTNHNGMQDANEPTTGEGNNITRRDMWVGLKGGFGEFRFGRHSLPSDLLDDHTDFMTNGGALNQTPGRQDNALAYIGSFGPVTAALAHVADGSDTGADKANDIALSYKAGPLTASIGHVSIKGGGNDVTGLGLSYSGANYGVGFKHDKKTNSKQNTLSGRYSFGKAYVAAEYGKNKDLDKKSQIIELGYGLGKATKVYFENSKQTTGATSEKNNRLGLVHSF